MKSTEAGYVPVDWLVKPLAEVATFLDGQRRPVKDSDRARMQGSIPYFGASGIVDYVNAFLFNEELILLGEDGENIVSRTCRLAFRISGKAWVNNHAHVLRPKHDVCIGYLADYLESLNYEQYNSGTAQPKLNKQTCSRIPIALPSDRAEQMAIADTLGNADALIESLEQLLAKKHKIKQGAMQELLTGQRRLPGFSGEWTAVRLERLGNVYGGLSGKTKVNFGRGSAQYIPFMNVMANPVIDSHWLESVEVAADESQNLTRRGDLFFNGSSETPEEVGLCSVLLDEVPNLYLNSFCFGFRFRLEAEVAGLFWAYWFRSSAGRRAVSHLAQGATRYNISKAAFLRLGVPSVTFAEQTAIATTLSDIDAEISALQARLTKARLLKQGMMQALLTGRIRLVPPQEEQG